MAAIEIEEPESTITNIPIANIIQDTPMKNWCKENAKDKLSEVKPMKLPKSKDTTIGSLKQDKIDSIQNAYDQGEQNLLPPIRVKQFGNTPYYEVLDGRHRSVMALKNGEPSVPAQIMQGGKKTRSYPKRYIPKRLTKKDKRKQRREINKSRKAYKKKKYYTRKKVKSFKSKESPHITKAKKMYKINTISASSNLAKKTKCSVGALSKIVKKGQGAYYSSGSRPNQTGHSWGRARLASSITGGKAAAVDFKILEAGCKPDSKALRLAKSSKRRNGFGTRRVPKYKGGVPAEEPESVPSPMDISDEEDDNNDDVPFDAAAAAAVDREMADEAYREPSRQDRAVQNITEFITYLEISNIGNMDLDQQKELIQEKMATVVRDNIPILRDSRDEYYRGVADTFEQTYRRLLEQIEERNKTLYRMSQDGGNLSNEPSSLTYDDIIKEYEQDPAVTFKVEMFELNKDDIHPNYSDQPDSIFNVKVKELQHNGETLRLEELPPYKNKEPLKLIFRSPKVFRNMEKNDAISSMKEAARNNEYDVEGYMYTSNFSKDRTTFTKTVCLIYKISQGGGALKMKERIISFERGPGEKKYTAHIINNKTKKRRIVHFGHKDYEQFKDRTPNKLYSNKDHGDKKRQENYYNRHSGEKNRSKAIKKEIKKGKGFYTAKILSHKYLW